MTRTDRRAIAVALAAAALACARSSSDPPTLSGVSPPLGAAHRPRPITIHGDAFRVVPVMDVSSGGASLDARFRAWLGTTELQDVAWQDEQNLTAVVPAGLPPATYALTVEDPFGRRATLADAYEATLQPAVLQVTFASLPDSVNVGQELVAAVRVRNVGQATALGVTVAIDASPANAVSAGPAPAPVDIPGGQEAVVSRTFVASAATTLTVSASAAGTDALTGQAVGDSASRTVVVQAPAALEATFTLGNTVDTGDLSLVLSVRNTGGATLQDVAAGPLSATGVGVEVGTPPGPVAALAGGATATFTWPLRLRTGGTLQVSAGVAGTDANDGRTVSASASASAAVREATLLAADPLGDGSSVVFVVAYRGQVVLGPNRTGDALVRMAPDGAAPASVPLSFRRDSTGGNVASSNASALDGIGFTGCTNDGVLFTCGPDVEDGRGLLESFVVGGVEWLLLGGARSGGDLDYVYVTSDPATAPTFSYVDLSQLLGSNTRGISAARAVNGRVYLGFADNGSKRPYGTVLLRLPASGAAGLDANPSAVPPDAIDLELEKAIQSIPGYASLLDPIAMVDEIVELGGHIYLFDDVGCIRSSGPSPALFSDFSDCSPPAGPAYDATESIAPPRQFDLEPRDRAWPRAAVWQGRLHVVRNTSTGPQLWSCDPALTDDPTACDPADWSLVAGDGSYRTRLGPAGAQAASLLAATDRYLYVGFDDPAGVRVYRTDAAAPAVASDFAGAGGCLASDPGCAGVSGTGLGVAATRVRDAKALTFAGRSSLYLVVGSGTSPAQLVRIRD